MRPVNSFKNDTDTAQLALAVNATTNFNFASAVNTYAGGLTEVPIGARVNAVYVEIYASSRSTTPEVIDWYIAKNPGTALTLPNANAVGGNANRKWIFKHHTFLAGQQDGGIMRFAGWIKIPRKMQRFGELDVLTIRAYNRTLGGSWDFLAHCIYKVYQ